MGGAVRQDPEAGTAAVTGVPAAALATAGEQEAATKILVAS
jgi:hypothetical protein